MRSVEEIEKSIVQVIAQIRHYLQEDDGDVEFVRYETKARVAEVRMLGSCRNCPLAPMTLRAGIERFVIKYVPEVDRIEAVK